MDTLPGHLTKCSSLLQNTQEGLAELRSKATETSEKTSGTTVLCDSGCSSQGLLSQPDTSVTRDCIAICKQTGKSPKFINSVLFGFWQ